MLQICCICKEEEAKYKCPACGRRTCSLKCSQSHKSEFHCTGNQDVTSFVDRSSLLSTPHQLNRDYRFLQNINRRLELSERQEGPLSVTKPRGNGNRNRNQNRNRQNRAQTHARGHQQQNEPNEPNDANWTLVNGAKVFHLPVGMERVRMNKSGWNHKLKKFFWTVEWVDETQEYHRRDVDANMLVQDVFQCHQDVDVYFKVVHCPVNKPKVVPVDKTMPLNDVLQSRSIIEFPSFILCSSTEIPQGYKVLGEESESGSSSSGSSSDNSDSSQDESSSSDEDSSEDSDKEEEEEEGDEEEDDDDDFEEPPEEASSKILGSG